MNNTIPEMKNTTGRINSRKASELEDRVQEITATEQNIVYLKNEDHPRDFWEILNAPIFIYSQKKRNKKGLRKHLKI